MQPNPKAEGARWLRQAKSDLDDARYTLEGNRFHLTCFLAQQAAEKALKAFIYSQGEGEVYGHSVAELCELAKRFDPDFSELKRGIAPLDKYYIPTRYPNGLPGGIPAEAFDEIDARRALELGSSVIEFVERKLLEG